MAIDPPQTMQKVAAVSEVESSFRGPGGMLHLRTVQPAHPWASAGVIHGYGDHSGRHLPAMWWLAERGVACHAFDFRGQGRSEGRRGFVHQWDEYLDDLDAFLKLPNFDPDQPRFLLAHSHGALVLSAAVERGVSGVAGCILTSPYFAPRFAVPRYKIGLAHLLNPILPWLTVASGLGDEMMTSDPAMRAESKADPLVVRGATPRWYLGSLEAQSRVLAAAGRFTLPLLLLFGSADPIALEAAARAFFESAGSIDKTFKLYPGLLHEILRETTREQVFIEIFNWMRRGDPP